MNRRGFLRGVGALIAAPAIVRVSSLMAVSPLPADWPMILRTRTITVEEFAERYLGPAARLLENQMRVRPSEMRSIRWLYFSEDAAEA